MRTSSGPLAVLLHTGTLDMPLKIGELVGLCGVCVHT